MTDHDFSVLSENQALFSSSGSAKSDATRARISKLQAAVIAAMAAHGDAIPLTVAHEAIMWWARDADEFFHDPPEDLSDDELRRCRLVHQSLMAICVAISQAMNYQWRGRDA